MTEAASGTGRGWEADGEEDAAKSKNPAPKEIPALEGVSSPAHTPRRSKGSHIQVGMLFWSGTREESSAVVCIPLMLMIQRGVMLQWAEAGTLTSRTGIILAHHQPEAFLPAHGCVGRTKREEKSSERGFPCCAKGQTFSTKPRTVSAISFPTPVTGITGSAGNRPGLCVLGQAAGIFVCLSAR